jgi:hypothetical protein
MNEFVGNLFIVGGAVSIFTMIGTSMYKDYKTGLLKKEYEAKLAALKSAYDTAVAKLK